MHAGLGGRCIGTQRRKNGDNGAIVREEIRGGMDEHHQQNRDREAIDDERYYMLLIYGLAHVFLLSQLMFFFSPVGDDQSLHKSSHKRRGKDVMRKPQ